MGYNHSAQLVIIWRVLIAHSSPSGNSGQLTVAFNATVVLETTWLLREWPA